MRILGIDPGMSGAAAVFDTDAPDMVEATDFPLMGEESQREIDGLALAEWIRSREPDHAFIELVSAMPSIPGADGKRRGMGAASAFRFGIGVGAIRATVQICRLPYTLVVPTKWKKLYLLKGGDKEPSRQRALQLFPRSAPLFARKKDHQRAEAALMAAYGARVLQA
jgi:hypothetical protein